MECGLPHLMTGCVGGSRGGEGRETGGSERERGGGGSEQVYFRQPFCETRAL